MFLSVGGSASFMKHRFAAQVIRLFPFGAELAHKGGLSLLCPFLILVGWRARRSAGRQMAVGREARALLLISPWIHGRPSWCADERGTRGGRVGEEVEVTREGSPFISRSSVKEGNGNTRGIARKCKMEARLWTTPLDTARLALPSRHPATTAAAAPLVCVRCGTLDRCKDRCFTV